MGFSEFETKKYEMILKDFKESIRPPKDVRDQLDISFRIDHQSIFIFEIRPEYENPSSKMEIDIAKSTYVRTQNL